jgi:hypothetical protein
MMSLGYISNAENCCTGGYVAEAIEAQNSIECSEYISNAQNCCRIRPTFQVTGSKTSDPLRDRWKDFLSLRESSD